MARPLSPRELEVLRAIAAEGDYRSAARSLPMSEATFETHLRNIRSKHPGLKMFQIALLHARELTLPNGLPDFGE